MREYSSWAITWFALSNRLNLSVLILSYFVFLRVGAVRDFGLSSDEGFPMSLIVYSSGNIFFSQPTIIRSACASNIADFPFDDQTCQLTFGSWTMDSSLLRLDLRDGGIDMTRFVKNSKWEVLEISPEVRMKQYFFQENDFSLVVYTIMVRRKSLFHVVNYLIPSVVILVLSLLLFLIPPEVGKRMGENCFRFHRLCFNRLWIKLRALSYWTTKHGK